MTRINLISTNATKISPSLKFKTHTFTFVFDGSQKSIPHSSHPLHSKDHSSPESYHDSNLMISYLVHLWKYLCFARIGKEKKLQSRKKFRISWFWQVFARDPKIFFFFLLGNFFTKSRFWQVTSCTTKGFYGFEDKVGLWSGWLRNH